MIRALLSDRGRDVPSYCLPNERHELGCRLVFERHRNDASRNLAPDREAINTAINVLLNTVIVGGHPDVLDSSA